MLKIYSIHFTLDEEEEEVAQQPNPSLPSLEACWKTLTNKEEIIGKWFGCIYTSKKSENLFIGKAKRPFVNDQGGLITALELDCLEQKLGVTDCIFQESKNADIDVFPAKNVICGPLNAKFLSHGRWEIPQYLAVRKAFEYAKKIDRQRVYDAFVCKTLKKDDVTFNVESST